MQICQKLIKRPTVALAMSVRNSGTSDFFLFKLQLPLKMFWAVTPRGLVGRYQRLEKHTVSIFSSRQGTKELFFITRYVGYSMEAVKIIGRPTSQYEYV
jgi:hypothetical protein